jgi:OPA family glycerol-3-phosphate transporter-like MFS transporter
VPIAAPTADARLPLATLATLFVGYACSYFHRADLAVLGPLWNGDAASAAMAAALPDIASLGLFVYALGKFVGGALAERFGGRRLFVGALATACVAELAAAACTTPGPFAVCRVVGMLVLALAWPALGHIVHGLVPRHRLATVMAFLSQSYLLGDAAVRAVLALVLERGGGAPEVLRTASLGLCAGAVLSGGMFLLLRQRRLLAIARTNGDAAPRAADVVAMATDGQAERASWRAMGWLAGMNVALAIVRESLSFWSPVLLVEVAAMRAEDAVQSSALLPLVSGVGVLLAGPFADRGPRALSLVLVPPAVLGALGLFWLGQGPAQPTAVLVVLALCSGVLAMPTSLASGVLPLRAARHGGAKRLGLVDGAGTLGAVLAGSGIGRVREHWSTAVAFTVLAVVALVAACFACGYLRRQAALNRDGAAAPPHR